MRDRYFVEDELRSCGSTDTELVVVFAELKAFISFFYDKGANTFGTGNVGIRCKYNIGVSLRRICNEYL